MNSALRERIDAVKRPDVSSFDAVDDAFALLAVMLAMRPAAERENTLLGIEEGGALQH
jgi:hypothetical protein